jgi:NADH-quinone oxidoreductase subunit N
MGKLVVFRAAVDAGLVPLAIVGVLSSVVGLYYYLRIVVVMYMQRAPEGSLPVPSSWPMDVVLAGAALVVLLIGLGPGWLATAAAAATRLAGG